MKMYLFSTLVLSVLSVEVFAQNCGNTYRWGRDPIGQQAFSTFWMTFEQVYFSSI